MSFNFDLDAVIFIGFLTINLAVGIFYSTGVKTVKEYALGTGFTTSALIATIVATHVDGGAFSIDLVESYREGLYYILTASAFLFRFAFVSYFMIPKMGKFIGTLSVQEAIEKNYGKYAGLIAGIISFVLSVGYVAIQLKLAGSIMQLFFPALSTLMSILLICIIVTLYSAFGGIKAVTLTDIFQFITFGILIPYLCIVIWSDATNDPMEIFDKVKDSPLYDFKEIFDINNPRFIQLIAFQLVCTIPAFDPAFFQRITMQLNVKQAQKSFLIAGIILFVLYSIISYIAVIIFASDPNIDPDNLLNYVLGKYTYPGFKALLAVGIMACIMSTADSYINSAAVILGHDIRKVFSKKILSSKVEVALLRASTIFASFFALALAYGPNGVYQLYMKMLSLYMPVVTVPLYVAIYGYKTSEKAIIFGMVASLISVFITSNYTSLESGEVVVGMSVNLIVILITHYTTIGPIYKQDASKKKFENFYGIKNFINSSFSSWIDSLKPSWLYQFAGATSILALSLMHHSDIKDLQLTHFTLFTFIYLSNLACAFLLLIEPILPLFYRNLSITPYLRLVMGIYVLVYVPSLLLIITHFGSLTALMLMFNTIILTNLIGWQNAFGAFVISIIINTQFCYGYITEQGKFSGLTGENVFQIIYMMLLVFIISISLLRKKQNEEKHSRDKIFNLNIALTQQNQELENLTNIKDIFLRNLQHETNTPLTGIFSMSQALSDCYDKLSENQRKDAIDSIKTSSERLVSYVHNLVDISKLMTQKYKMDLRKIYLSRLLEEVVHRCKKFYIENDGKDERVIKLNIEPNIIINGDEYLIKKSFKSLILNAIQYCKKGEIEIALIQKKDAVIFSVKDTGIGIPEEELLDIFEPFATSSRTTTLAGGRGLSLTLVRETASLHGGTIVAESDESGSVFTMTLLP